MAFPHRTLSSPTGARRVGAAVRRGFTLLEVVVAIAIASFAVAALYGLFTVQSRQFVMQDLQMEMHQNLRFATEMLTRSLRVAGNGTNLEVTGVMGVGGDGNTLPTLVSWDADGPNGTDAVTLVYANPSLMMDTSNGVVQPCDTDQLEFRMGMLDNQERLEQFEAGELVVCFDYADQRGMETYMWTVSGDPDTTNGILPVTANTGYADFAAICPTDENLTPVMSCSKADVFTFYIDDTVDGVGPGSEEHPVLMLDMNQDWPADDDVPLVDNIEDLQLEYCVDDSTGVSCADSANWTDSFATTQTADVWMARVSLIARSSREEMNHTYIGTRPALANRSAATTQDHYYREVLTTEVVVRNARAQANL